MKNLFILSCALCIAMSVVCATETEPDKTLKQPVTKEEMIKQRKAREAVFEQKLGLTEEQKSQARELRKKGHERMQPVIQQIKAKHQEARMVKLSRISIQEQEAKLAVIDNELKVLEKKIKQIRKQNMKEFESILTTEQRKTLKNMKKEGRKHYNEAHRPPHPPMEAFQEK